MSLPTREQFAANIPKYFLYMALKGFGFGLFVAIWVIYLQERRGMSLSQAAIVDATFFVVAAFGEVPTGIVADLLGRKTSISIGVALMSVGVLSWAFAPTLPLIMLAYAALGIGFTFTSGAEDALFYESLQLAERGNDYVRLAGRAGATFTGALALGSAVGGMLGEIDLILPYPAAGFVLVLSLIVVLFLREPRTGQKSVGQEPKSFGEILRQSFVLMRERPTLRYPILYLALVPLVSFMVETVFLQPQAILLGVPIAGVGVIYMAIQIINMMGGTWSEGIKKRFGEARILYAAPIVFIVGLILLAALQVFPALVFIIIMGFLTAVLRPIVLNRIQSEVSDDVRATVISMQSLTFAILGAITQPTLGFVADRAGLPTAYLVLAVSLGVLMVSLFWISRHHFPKPVTVVEAQA
jgi:MFS family permease